MIGKSGHSGQPLSGSVVWYDKETGLGSIEVEAGSGYGFTIHDWHEEAPPVLGDAVSFEIEDGVAVEILVEKKARVSRKGVAARAAASVTSALATARAKGAAAAGASAPAVSHRSSRFADCFSEWPPVLAVASLLAGFTPLLGGGSASIRLYDVAGTIGTTRAALSEMTDTLVASGLAATGSYAPAIEAIARIDLALGLGYLIYVVPLAAIGMLVAVYRGVRVDLARRIHIYTSFLPLVLMLGATLILPDRVDAGVAGRFLVPTPFALAGMGIWLFALIGGLQFAVATGAIGQRLDWFRHDDRAGVAAA